MQRFPFLIRSSLFQFLLFNPKLFHSHVWCCIFWQQPGIILLKEGTDSSQGVPQLISNINACQFIADAVRTTLGPRGMDKLIVNSSGGFQFRNIIIIRSSDLLSL